MCVSATILSSLQGSILCSQSLKSQILFTGNADRGESTHSGCTLWNLYLYLRETKAYV